MKRFCFLLSGLLLLTVSCTSEKPARKTGTFQRNPEVFQKLKDYSLQLSLLSSRREFYAGEERAVLIFSLKNTGLRPVTIYEWHTFEPANINLYYRLGTAESAADGAKWQMSPTHDASGAKLSARSPLTLNPGSNQALIQVPAVFLKDLPNPNGKKQPYTLRAVLNLKSVAVESLPVEIYVK